MELHLLNARFFRCQLSLGAVVLVACAISGCASQGISAVIEPETLANRSRPIPVMLDVRDAADYDARHVAGAVRVDPKQWHTLSIADETGLDHRDQWIRRIGDLGIDGREPVIVYDGGKMTDAARVWFILQHFGAENVAVVNGGYPALGPSIAEGRIAADSQPVQPHAAVFRPSGTAASVTLADRDRVGKAVERGEAQILDVRTPEEYRGLDLRNNTRGGHLPAAINLPHTDLLDDSGRLKSPGELANIFAAAGLKRGRPIITHCDGGGRASLAALAAARAGYGPVSNYYLSYGNWAADPSCPVVGGD